MKRKSGNKSDPESESTGRKKFDMNETLDSNEAGNISQQALGSVLVIH